jgi:hypothetical protein
MELTDLHWHNLCILSIHKHIGTLVTALLQLEYPNTTCLSALACVSVSDLLLTILTLDALLFELHAACHIQSSLCHF